jgi:hypothetical protein
MAEALAYAQGDGPQPDELRLANAITRFGVEAVTGKRILRPGLLRRITMAENVVAAFEIRAKAENWAAFGNQYPDLAELLFRAQEAMNNE